MEYLADILTLISLTHLGLLGLLGGLLGGGGGGGAQPIQSAPMPETEDLGQVPQQLTKNTSATLTSSLLDDSKGVDQEFQEEQAREEQGQGQAPVSPTVQKARESEPADLAINQPEQPQQRPGGLLAEAIDQPEPAPVKPPITPPEPQPQEQQQQQQQQQQQGNLRRPITTQFSLRRF